MRVKLQPASRSDLPTYNPILPPTAITQVMLIANPNRVSGCFFAENLLTHEHLYNLLLFFKEQIRLKYKINYAFDDLVFNEADELKSLPIVIDLL